MGRDGMKVLAICEGLYPPTVEMSGISMVYKLQRALCEEGVDVHVLTAIEKFTDPSWRRWYREHTPPTFHPVDMKLITRFPRLQFMLTKALLFPVALRLQAKHHFDIIHEYTSTPFLVRRTAWYRRLAGVGTVHTLCIGQDGLLGLPGLMGKNPAVDRVICTSARMSGEMLIRGVNRQKIVHLPLGVDFNHFQDKPDVTSLRSELDIPAGSLVILHLGLLEPRKGVFTLAGAAPAILKEHPEAIFLIAASVTGGTFYNYQKSRRELLKVIEPYKDNFRLLTGQQEICRLMALADIFVLPLNTMHGTVMPPVSLLEAMAAGKAVVVSDLRGVEVVNGGENGLLFPAGDSGALAKAINRLLLDHPLRQKLGLNARKSARPYDVRLMARELKKLYEKIISGRKA
jgi:phosphatidylinositol alpha-mannosyltransferase